MADPLELAQNACFNALPSGQQDAATFGVLTEIATSLDPMAETDPRVLAANSCFNALPSGQQRAAIFGALNEISENIGAIGERDDGVVYADGVIIQDETGIYRGDGVTPGGVLLASPSFSVAAAETFSRSGAAIDYITGEAFADGVKHTRTLRYPRWDSEPAIGVLQYPLGTKALRCVTATGAILATDATSPNTAYLYRSTDGGGTWTTFTWGASSGATVTSVIAIAGPTKEILVAWTQEGGTNMRVSVDDGVTWTSALLTSSYFSNITGDFSCGLFVEQPPGRALGDCKLLFAPYGSRISYALSEPSSGPVRVFRSGQTLSAIEATPGSLTLRLLWKMDYVNFYSPTGLNRYATQEKIPDGVAESAGANTITETGKFAAINATYKPYIRIDTDPNGTPAGAAVGQTRRIASKNDDTATLAANWTVVPSAGATYRVVELFSDGDGIHIHGGCYAATLSDATTDAIFLGVGDNKSACILKIAGASALTDYALDAVIGGDGVNWTATTLCSVFPAVTGAVQPTSLRHNGTHIVCAATDTNLGTSYKMLDVSPYTITPTVWNFYHTSATAPPDYMYPFDAIHRNGLDVVGCDGAASRLAGIMVGDASELDGLTRIFRVTAGNIEHASGSSRFSRHSNYAVEIPDEVEQYTGVFLGEAETELLTNTDFALISTDIPTGWSKDTWGTCTGVVTNTATPVFGGGNYLAITRTATSNAPGIYQEKSSGIVGGDVYQFQVAVRIPGDGLASRVTAEIWSYTGSTYLDKNSSPAGQNLLAGGWQVISAMGACNAAANKLRCQVKISNTGTGTWQIASPSLIKRAYHGPIGGRAADVLEYALASTAYNVGRNTRLEFYLRPFRFSPTARAVTEDIVSIESHDGYRFLLQYIDDGAGTQAFQFKTFDSAGTDIATTSLGMIVHSMMDVFRIRVTHQNARLRCEIASPSETLSGSQSWTRVWWPKQIEYGVNQWSAGSRFIGWYAHVGVTQQ